MGTLTSGHSRVLSGRAVTTATKQFLNSCHPSCHLNQINHYRDLREGEAPIYRIQMFPPYFIVTTRYRHDSGRGGAYGTYYGVLGPG